jgi:hypothetical protein
VALEQQEVAACEVFLRLAEHRIRLLVPAYSFIDQEQRDYDSLRNLPAIEFGTLRMRRSRGIALAPRSYRGA